MKFTRNEIRSAMLLYAVTDRSWLGERTLPEVTEEVLRSGAKYLGCIGSKRKLALCRERLLAAGFTDEEYARLHAPIGLAIGAQTPEEIAVSVAAEMIAVRAGLENGLRRPLG